MSLLALAHAVVPACAALGTASAIYGTRTMSRALSRSRMPARAGAHGVIRVPVAEAVFGDLRSRAAAQRTTVSGLSVDLLAAITGHPQWVRGLDPATLHLGSLLAHAIETPVKHPGIGTRIRTAVLLPQPVYAEIQDWAAAYPGDAGQIAADLLAIASGHPETVRDLDRLDMLRLAGHTIFGSVERTDRKCTS